MADVAVTCGRGALGELRRIPLLSTGFLALLLLLSACGGGNNGPTLVPSLAVKPPGPPAAGPWVVPLDRRFWHQHYNSTVNPAVFFAVAPPMKPIADGLSEIFPPSTANIRFNYLVYPIHTDISRFSSITLTIRVEAIEGTPVFIWKSPANNCTVGCMPASAHIMLWGPPGDLFSTHDRWWGDAFITMAPGTASVTVSLDSAHWTGVNGQLATSDPAFEATLHQLVALCITFGGGFFAGHGLFTTGGKAEFDLLGCELE